MTQHQETSIRCPGCGRSQQFRAYGTLNSTLHPFLKEQLLNGSLTEFRCQLCRYSTQVEYPMLYHDMHANTMIYLYAAGELPSVEMLADTMGDMREVFISGTFRHVRSRNDLIEKIKILDDGHDDRLIECIKTFLIARMDEETRRLADQFYYDGEDFENIHFAVISSENRAGRFSMSRRDFETYLEKLPALLPPRESEEGRWLCVNREYAEELLIQWSLENSGANQEEFDWSGLSNDHGASKPSRSPTNWGLLMTGFGLAIVGIVVVAGGIKFVQGKDSWQQQQREQAIEQEEQIRKIRKDWEEGTVGTSPDKESSHKRARWGR